MLESLTAALGQLITVYFVLFLLAVVFFVKMQRMAVELIANKYFPSFVKSKIWRSFLLYCAPSGTGVILATIMSSYPYPELLTSTSGHMIYGVGVGLLSNMLYSMIKELAGTTLKTLADQVKSKVLPSKSDGSDGGDQG